MEKHPAVYIMTNEPYGTLYVGITTNLQQRVWDHKHKTHKGFTEKYNLDRLVWFEMHEEVVRAIEREKQLKNWKRDWKVELIEKDNPAWLDLTKRWD